MKQKGNRKWNERCRNMRNKKEQYIQTVMIQKDRKRDGDTNKQESKAKGDKGEGDGSRLPITGSVSGQFHLSLQPRSHLLQCQLYTTFCLLLLLATTSQHAAVIVIGRRLKQRKEII